MTAIRGEPYHDERTGITIDGGWWGLLPPRLEALPSPPGTPGLASLHAARDGYNAEREPKSPMSLFAISSSQYLRRTAGARAAAGCDAAEWSRGRAQGSALRDTAPVFGPFAI